MSMSTDIDTTDEEVPDLFADGEPRDEGTLSSNYVDALRADTKNRLDQVTEELAELREIKRLTGIKINALVAEQRDLARVYNSFTPRRKS
jgi:hypothetical protein